MMTNPACAPVGNAIFSDDISTPSMGLGTSPRLDQLAASLDASSPLALARKYVGVIGSRQLPAIYKEKVKEAVMQLLGKGYNVASGGAAGADNFALESLLELSAAPRGIIFSPWREIEQFPIPVQENMKKFIAQSGRVVWGDVPRYADREAVVAGLLGRNVRLVSGAVGLIAFPFGDSRGTAFTLRRAQQKGIPVRIVQTN